MRRRDGPEGRGSGHAGRPQGPRTATRRTPPDGFAAARKRPAPIAKKELLLIYGRELWVLLGAVVDFVLERDEVNLGTLAAITRSSCSRCSSSERGVVFGGIRRS